MDGEPHEGKEEDEKHELVQGRDSADEMAAESLKGPDLPPISAPASCPGS